MNELENPDLEAGDEVVVETQEADADGQETNEEGQVETQPEGDEPEAEKAEADAPDDDAPKKSRHQRRKEYIDGLKEEKRNAEAARDRIKAAGKSVAEPKEDDYEDFDEFRAARAFWRERQRERQADVQAADEVVTQQDGKVQQELDALWAASVVEARSSYQDFDKIALDTSLPISTAMAGIIKGMDQGPDVLYHLGSNPATAHRIAMLPPVEAAMELGRLEATLQAPPPRQKTKAPEPINPVRGNAATQKDPTKMSPDEFRAWRQSGGTF
jgi:hypothetical protein